MSIVHLEPNSHLLKSFNNCIFHLIQGFHVPLNRHISPYILQERTNLVVEVVGLDDNLSAHLSLTSALTVPLGPALQAGSRGTVKKVILLLASGSPLRAREAPACGRGTSLFCGVISGMEKASDRFFVSPIGCARLTLVSQRQTDCSALSEEKEEHYPDPWSSRSFE